MTHNWGECQLVNVSGVQFASMCQITFWRASDTAVPLLCSSPTEMCTCAQNTMCGDLCNNDASKDRSPSAASFLLAPVHAGVLPCPSGVQVSLHCDREMETPWPQYKILSHSQHLKWLYAFFFHKRFKYMGPYVAQDAWNSENYENNSSPPLRIFHLYKAENTKY